MEWMVLAEFFPSGGIPGVGEEPVYGDDRAVLRDALGLAFNEECLFHRLTSLKGKASDWFLVGDVVCRRIGLDEERCDVLRQIQDRVFISSSSDASVFEDGLEELRREAIERHAWKVHRSETWSSVIDSQGRALVVAYKDAHRQWRKVMEQLIPRRNTSRAAKTPAYRVSAAWCALKALHSWFFYEHQGDVDRKALMKSEYLVRDVYDSRVKIGQYIGAAKVVKMRKFRSGIHLPFWRRCSDMLESGERVPLVVRHVHEHPCTRWVGISVDDAEWLLGCSWWPEWKGKGPVRFDKFARRGESGNRNWK
jgi:hypothetical protein